MNPFAGQKLLETVAATIEHRQLLRGSERILLGVSGGKDSLALLDCLYRLGYSQLHSIHIRIDRDAPVVFAEFCAARSTFHLVETDILNEVRTSRRRNSCFICSRARRKALSDFALNQGFDTLVLAHHKNDAVETLLLNLFFQREISTLLPVQELAGGRLHIIRPFYDADEKTIRRYAKALQLPVTDWNCGLEQNSRRAWLREQLFRWQKAHPRVRLTDNIFAALHNVNSSYLPASSTQDKAQNLLKKGD
jgi:tRNA 2-thiocytidine biosynthesis protein TtcA